MDFDLNAPQESIDKVPEQFRPIFAQGEDGKFKVDPKFTGVASAIVGFNKSNQALREELKGKKSVDLSPLAEFGNDPATIKANFDARVAELVAKGGDAAKAVERVRSEMSAAHKAALDAANANGSRYQNLLHTHLVRSEALAAISAEKGVAELLMPFIQNQVKVTEVDGRFSVVVLDDKGEPRYSGLTGAPMTLAELVKGMKADPKFGRLFESDQQGGGGGMQPGAGRRGNPNVNDGTEKTAANKIRDGLAKRYPSMAGRR